MKVFKRTIITVFYNLGYFDLLRKIRKNHLTILMYHRFSDKNEPFKIRNSVFENQLKFLLKNYNFISLSQYSRHLVGSGESLPQNPVILTFDDGYLDNYLFAYPIIKKYSIPATIFLTTDFINHKAWLWSNKLEYILRNAKTKEFKFQLGEDISIFKVGNFSEWHKTQLKIFNYLRLLPELEKNRIISNLAELLKVDVPEQTQTDFMPLNWEQIREMSKNNLEFGSHTCSHPILSRLTLSELEYEIIRSKQEIENKLQNEIFSFAYPNGTFEDFNSDTISFLKNNLYKCAVTTIPGQNYLKTVDPFRLKRISTDIGDHKNLSVKLGRP